MKMFLNTKSVKFTPRWFQILRSLLMFKSQIGIPPILFKPVLWNSNGMKMMEKVKKL